MPCYEAPPEYEGDARRNAEQAVRIMCAEIRASIRAGVIPPEDRLRWYKEHRGIDLRIAREGRRLDREDPAAIMNEILLLERLLSGEKP